MTDHSLAGVLARLDGLREQWTQRAKMDARYGIGKALPSNREYFGTVNAAYALFECAQELGDLLTVLRDARQETSDERMVKTLLGAACPKCARNDDLVRTLSGKYLCGSCGWSGTGLSGAPKGNNILAASEPEAHNEHR